jgi:hypothetical protein
MKSRGTISEISFPPELANARVAFPPEKIDKIVAPVGSLEKLPSIETLVTLLA